MRLWGKHNSNEWLAPERQGWGEIKWRTENVELLLYHLMFVICMFVSSEKHLISNHLNGSLWIITIFVTLKTLRRFGLIAWTAWNQLEMNVPFSLWNGIRHWAIIDEKNKVKWDHLRLLDGRFCRFVAVCCCCWLSRLPPPVPPSSSHRLAIQCLAVVEEMVVAMYWILFHQFWIKVFFHFKQSLLVFFSLLLLLLLLSNFVPLAAWAWFHFIVVVVISSDFCSCRKNRSCVSLFSPFSFYFQL